MTLREHVRSHTATLLRRLAFQVRQTVVNPDESAVHDLRVCIRRLREYLRAFEDIFPAGPRKKIRKELRKLMKQAERVRSADIALDLLQKAGMDNDSHLVQRIRSERKQDRSQLHEELKALAARRYSRNWRGALGL